MWEFISLNRLFFYLSGFLIFNIVDLYFAYLWKQKLDLEFELLNTSFNLDKIQNKNMIDNYAAAI